MNTEYLLNNLNFSRFEYLRFAHAQLKLRNMADDCLPETCKVDTSDDTCIVVDSPSNSRMSSTQVKSEI